MTSTPMRIACSSLAALLLVGACSGGDKGPTPPAGGSGGGGAGGGGGGAGGAGGGGGGAGGGGGGAGGGGGGAGGSGPGTSVGHAFGSHSTKYADGSILPTGGQKVLDDAVRAYYAKWKGVYLKAECGGYYVFSNGGAGAGADTFITQSEAHGYGMMIAALMAGEDPDAQKIFDGFVALVKKNPSIHYDGLMAWGIDKGCMMIKDGDSATDGDQDMAYAYLLAEKQWGNAGAIKYGDEGRKLVMALQSSSMNPTTKLPLLGDWATPDDAEYYNISRSSDWTTDHYRVFAKAMGGDFWTGSVDAVYKLVDIIQTKYSPMTGLIPDFVDKTNTMTPVVVPTSFADDPAKLGEDLHTDYDYNACRVPWRLGTDFLVNGEARAKTALARMNTFIKAKTNNDPTKIVDGYSLAGDPWAMAGPNDCFTAPFGVSGMIDASNQAWVDAVWKHLTDGKTDDYYGDTIRLLTLIVMSGNWWAP